MSYDSADRPTTGRRAAADPVDPTQPGYTADTADTEYIPASDGGAYAVDRDDRVVDADDRVVDRDDRHLLHGDALAREEERFGGIKFGSAFFGWLTAMGMAVLLTALVAAIGTAIGVGTGTTVDEAADVVTQNIDAAGVLGLVVLGLVLFIAYFAGGYVAGRMARFSGLAQGVAVWLWSLIIAVIVAVLTAFVGSEWNILANVNLPSIPVTPETATLTGILTAVGAAVITLVGAILGGIAGMRYHRRVDSVGLPA